MKRGSFFISLATAVCLVLIFLNLSVTLSVAQTSARRNSAVAVGHNGAVATVDPRATLVGIKVLRAGGNAIDAAVATAAALGVVEPFSAGIGGGGFMTIYLKDENRLITIDGREQAPATANVDMFKDPNSPTGENLPFFPERISSGVAVGVPGTVLEWIEALNRYGTLSLDAALAPAIALAENGFEVDPIFAQQVAINQQRFAAFTSTKALYLPGGKPPVIGSTFRNPDLAKTYRLLSRQGINTFYRGEIGQAIVETVQNPPTVANPPFVVVPGGMTLADLDQYAVRVRPPVAIDYRGYKVYGMGLPSSGGITTSEVLKIVEGFDLAQIERTSAWHTIIEAERLAYADRATYLGDPEYVDVPVPGLLSSEFAAVRRKEIGPSAPVNEAAFRATSGNPLPYQSDPSPSMSVSSRTTTTNEQEGRSTTHLVVSDRSGNVVSYTLTIETTGGSGIVVPGYGFLLNNELTDFDPTSPSPNSPEPSKRPRSSMAPTIAFAPDGTVLAFGSPGGSTIITTVLGLAVNLFDFGLPIEQAIAAERISQRNVGVTEVDSGLEKTQLGQGLAALDHILLPVPEIGAATGIVLSPNGTITAAAEPVRRGSGSAMVVSP